MQLCRTERLKIAHIILKPSVVRKPSGKTGNPTPEEIKPTLEEAETIPTHPHKEILSAPLASVQVSSLSIFGPMLPSETRHWGPPIAELYCTTSSAERSERLKD